MASAANPFTAESSKLDGSNYAIWSQKMRLHLMSYGVWLIVEGAQGRPPSAGDKQDKWDSRNMKAIGIIGQAMTTSVMLATGVATATSSKTLWETIKAKYGTSTAQTKFSLRAKLERITLHEGGDVPTFVNDFQACVEELKAAGYTISDDEIVMKLLHTCLPTSWSTFQSSMLLQPDDSLTPMHLRLCMHTFSLREYG